VLIGLHSSLQFDAGGDIFILMLITCSGLLVTLPWITSCTYVVEGVVLVNLWDFQCFYISPLSLFPFLLFFFKFYSSISLTYSTSSYGQWGWLFHIECLYKFLPNSAGILLAVVYPNDTNLCINNNASASLPLAYNLIWGWAQFSPLQWYVHSLDHKLCTPLTTSQPPKVWL